jgi:hypothetical protein
MMADPTGESKCELLRLDTDRRLMLRFRGSVITSDGGLLAHRELDDVLALTTSGGEKLAEAPTGKNRRHLLVGLLRQLVWPSAERSTRELHRDRAGRGIDCVKRHATGPATVPSGRHR